MHPPDISIFLVAKSSLKFESKQAASWSSLNDDDKVNNTNYKFC